MTIEISGLHTFRIKVPAKTDIAGQPECNVYHTRRAHKKSRSGCLYCKQRRRKCNEGKPSCSLCLAKNTPCVYEIKVLDKAGNSAALIRQHLWPGAKAPAVLITSCSEIRHTEFDLELLDHYIKSTVYEYEDPSMIRCYSTEVLELALAYPYLMHGVLAVAACHMQYQCKDTTKYQAIEAFHCHYASKGLRGHIYDIKGCQDSDALLTTSMMLNTLTYCAASYRDDKPFGLDLQHKPRWDWLRIQIGITSILMETTPFHPDSIWNFMFMATNDNSVLGPPETDLGRRLLKYCGIDRNSDFSTNPYAEFAGFMKPLVERASNKMYVPLYCRSIGAITTHYIDLMEQGDTKALLLFVYWLALMTCVDHWWCLRRTKGECWAICNILSRAMDPEDFDLLEMPAKACDFPLERALRCTTVDSIDDRLIEV